MFKKSIFTVSILSGIGIAGTFLFQVIAARMLLPEEYGLLAAFLAIVNIAAIGAGALQNAVTVQVAKTTNCVSPKLSSGSRLFTKLFSRFDATVIEATVLGGVGASLLLVMIKPISEQLNASPLVIVTAAVTIPISFYISKDLGILQGYEKTEATVLWSTVSSILRLMLVGLFLFVYSNAGTAIAGVLLALVITQIGLAAQVRKIGYISNHKPFNFATLSVIGATIFFAWLTNIDVVFVRALATTIEAGNYAVASNMVKSTLIVPGTISLFLLPRMAKNETNSAFGRALNLTLLISGFGIVALAGVFLLAGQDIFILIFGYKYDLSNEFLASVAFAFIPWVLSQALLIQINAKALFSGVLILFAACISQAVMFTISLPNIQEAIWRNGAVGIITLLALTIVLILKKGRRSTSS